MNLKVSVDRRGFYNHFFRCFQCKTLFAQDIVLHIIAQQPRKESSEQFKYWCYVKLSGLIIKQNSYLFRDMSLRDKTVMAAANSCTLSDERRYVPWRGNVDKRNSKALLCTSTLVSPNEVHSEWTIKSQLPPKISTWSSMSSLRSKRARI